MTSSKKTGDTCAGCWIIRHKCDRMAVGCCRRCSFHIVKSVNDDATCIRFSSSLNLSAAYQLLHPTSTFKWMAMPNTYSFDSGSLTLRIRPPNANVLQLILPLHEPFTIHNLDMMRLLDDFVEKHFSARLLGKRGCSLVGKASLAGGYLNFLCSIAQIVEVGETTEDAVNMDNGIDGYNLGAKLKYLLICRLSELVRELLAAVRPQQFCSRGQDWMPDAYAASVIMHCELYYFTTALRGSAFKTNFGKELTEMLINWFQSVDTELMERIYEGCGRFRHIDDEAEVTKQEKKEGKEDKSWRAPIAGSLRNLRRTHTPLQVSMLLSFPPSSSTRMVKLPNNLPSASMIPEQPMPDGFPSGAPHMSDILSGRLNFSPILSDNIAPPGVSVNVSEDLLPRSAHFDQLELQERSVTTNLAAKNTGGLQSLSESASLRQAPVFQNWTSSGALRPISFDSDPDAGSIDNEMSVCVRESNSLTIPGTTFETSSNGGNPSVAEDIFQDINFQDWDDFASGLAGSMENANSMVATNENELLYAAKEFRLGVATHTLLTAPEIEVLGLSTTATNQDQHTTHATPNPPQLTDPFMGHPSSHHSPSFNESGEMQDMLTPNTYSV